VKDPASHTHTKFKVYMVVDNVISKFETKTVTNETKFTQKPKNTAKIFVTLVRSSDFTICSVIMHNFAEAYAKKP